MASVSRERKALEARLTESKAKGAQKGAKKSAPKAPEGKENLPC